MRSIIRVDRSIKNYCDICTAKAHIQATIGREYTNNCTALQFRLCRECAAKLGKLITEAADEIPQH